MTSEFVTWYHQCSRGKCFCCIRCRTMWIDFYIIHCLPFRAPWGWLLHVYAGGSGSGFGVRRHRDTNPSLGRQQPFGAVPSRARMECAPDWHLYGKHGRQDHLFLRFFSKISPIFLEIVLFLSSYSLAEWQGSRSIAPLPPSNSPHFRAVFGKKWQYDELPLGFAPPPPSFREILDPPCLSSIISQTIWVKNRQSSFWPYIGI